MSEIKQEMVEEEVMGGGVSDSTLMGGVGSDNTLEALYSKLRDIPSPNNIPMSMPRVTISMPTVSISIPTVSSPLVSTAVSNSIPALIPVSRHCMPAVSQEYNRVMSAVSSPLSAVSSPISSPISSVLSSPRDVPWINGYRDVLNDSINASGSLQQNSPRNNPDINQQARKLADLLIKARSNLLLSNLDQSPEPSTEEVLKLQSVNNDLSGVTNDLSSLTKLIKTDQVLQLLQQALQQRQNLATFANNTQNTAATPSVILGGSRPSQFQPAPFSTLPSPTQFNPHTANRQPTWLGAKRKNCTKQSPQKIQKKSKHVGGSHGIQLWQFILELLGDKEHKHVLCWTGNGLEFRIINSVELARLWGIRKRNPIMNFDKLSRALRYYYEKNIIKHNPMHRLVYSFCNNPEDMVYNALLNRALVTCPIDPDLAKMQVGNMPYKDNNIPISVSLESIRNMANVTIPLNPLDDDKSPGLPVNNR